MPIFEYICKDCKHSFEKLVMGSAKPECPSCHGKQLAQKFSVFSASVPRSSSPAPGPMGGCCGGGACGRPGPCDN
jgi:putative FmdB family regulatory protein